MTYELDSGKRFGLPPIGLPQADMNTPGSDTERRAFPGLATKSSVFAWVDTPIQIVSRVTVTGTVTDTINLRNNTANGGSSMDVPTWSTGAYVRITYKVNTMGTSNYHSFSVSSPIVGGSVSELFLKSEVAATWPVAVDVATVIVPFYDEPIVIVRYTTDGTGTGTYNAKVVGFVRNV